MFRGVYTATSGMISASRKQEMLANNLANASTPGYKADHTVMRAFPEVLMKAMNTGGELNTVGKPNFIGSKTIGTMHNGVYAQEGILSFQQGALQQTDRFADMAIIDGNLPVNPDTNKKGHIFFAVDAGNGQIRYTKNGQFQVDAEGYLTTGDGYYVLNQNRERIQVGEGGFKVLDDGSISRDANGTPSGEKFWLGYTEDTERLEKRGNGLYEWTGGQGANEPQLITDVEFLNNNGYLTAFQVKQGFIESSNVDVTQTMTEMMTMYRQFEANQKVLQSYDRSMEKAVNEVGKVY